MPTTVTYNSRTLQYPKINRWDQEPVYDDSGINVLYVRHSVEIDFIVTGATPTAFQASLWGHQNDLAEHRKALLIDGGTGSDDHYVNLTGSSGANRIPDLEGGPKPGGLSILMLAGEISASCRWSIKFVYQNVGAAGSETGFTKNILAKSFQATFAIDREGRQTRTFTGTARLRDIDANSNAMTISRLRGIIPPCPYGFRRMSCNISVSQDALTVRAETVDSEITANWLHGIADILDATYTEGLPLFQVGSADVSFIIQKQLTLRLRGCKGFKKQDIIDVATAIIDSRFNFIDLASPPEDNQRANLGKDFPAQITWSESLFENEIGVTVLAWTIPKTPLFGTDENFFTAFLSSTFGTPIGPSSYLVSGHAQYGGGGGHDPVTYDHKGNDRLSFLTPVQRVIITELETHAIASSNPPQSGSDDFGLSPTRNVNSYIDGVNQPIQSPDEQIRLADTAGLGPGGYVTDDEFVDVKIDNGRIVMGSTSLGGGAQGSSATYQARAPRLTITQFGRAYRVHAAPKARNRITFSNDGDAPSVVEVSVVKPLPPMPFGPITMRGVHWSYRTSYNLLNTDIPTGDGSGQFRLNLAARELSARASRVIASAIQDQNNTVLTYNPDTEPVGAG